MKIVSYVLKEGISLARTTTLMKMLTNANIIMQIWNKFQAEKAERIHR
jgi:hypothetical protein